MSDAESLWPSYVFGQYICGQNVCLAKISVVWPRRVFGQNVFDQDGYLAKVFVAEQDVWPNCLRPKTFGQKECGTILNVVQMCHSQKYVREIFSLDLKLN